MKTQLLLAAALLAVSTANVSIAQGNPNADRYVVQLQADVDPVDVLADYAIGTPKIYRHALNGFAAQIPPGRLLALASDTRVAIIAVDRPVFAFGKPSKPSPTGTIPEGVKRIAAKTAWDAGITGAGVGVAIVDTGLDFNHQDLPVSDVSFVSPYFTYTESAQDDAGHGTHVGGIVAALQNDIDVVGVAPGATLYAVKVLDNTGSGYDSDVISGLEWVVKNATTVIPNIRVINMSLGRPAGTDVDDKPMYDAIKSVVDAGITVVVAAGNDETMEISQMVPAKFGEVIAVASTTAKAGTSKGGIAPIAADSASWFTTDGAGVAISAPGEDQENIQGAFVKSVGILSTAMGGGTTRMQGTSMASPHVAGAVALLLQNENSLSPAAVKARIMSGDKEGVAPLDSLFGSYDGVREGILYVPTVLALPVR